MTVEAAYSKRRRRDVLPVHPELAEELRGWFKGRVSDAPATLRLDGTAAVDDSPLWPGAWASYAAGIIRGDLDAAGLPYTDEAGGTFDFHALRHQFISMLAAAGVHPKSAQELARHSDINLTLSRYTHVGLRDTAAAVGRLPSFNVPQAAKATGTAGIEPGLVAPMVAPIPQKRCKPVRTAAETSTAQGMVEGNNPTERKLLKNAASDDVCGPMRTAELIAQGESRTPTGVTPQRILNPSRLPFRHPGHCRVYLNSVRTPLQAKRRGSFAEKIGTRRS